MAWFGPRGEGPGGEGSLVIYTRERELIIPKIMRSMAGQYRCTVFDHEFKKSSYVTVTVQCKCKGQERGKEGGGRERRRNGMEEREGNGKE